VPHVHGRHHKVHEDLRADLSHILTGLLHQRELDACVNSTREQIKREPKGEEPN